MSTTFEVFRTAVRTGADALLTLSRANNRLDELTERWERAKRYNRATPKLAREVAEALVTSKVLLEVTEKWQQQVEDAAVAMFAAWESGQEEMTNRADFDEAIRVFWQNKADWLDLIPAPMGEAFLRRQHAEAKPSAN